MPNINPFSKIGDARATRTGQWITPGRYKFEVHSLTEFPSAKDASVHWFAMEFTVLAASNGTPPGVLLTRLENIKSDIGLNNAKSFALSLAPDTKPEEVTPQLMLDLTGPDQPVKGVEVLAECIPKVSKKGNDYTVLNWYSAGSMGESFTAPQAPLLVVKKDEDVPF